MAFVVDDSETSKATFHAQRRRRRRKSCIDATFSLLLLLLLLLVLLVLLVAVVVIGGRGGRRRRGGRGGGRRRTSACTVLVERRLFHESMFLEPKCIVLSRHGVVCQKMLLGSGINGKGLVQRTLSLGWTLQDLGAGHEELVIFTLCSSSNWNLPPRVTGGNYGEGLLLCNGRSWQSLTSTLLGGCISLFVFFVPCVGT